MFFFSFSGNYLIYVDVSAVCKFVSVKDLDFFNHHGKICLDAQLAFYPKKLPSCTSVVWMGQS